MADKKTTLATALLDHVLGGAPFTPPAAVYLALFTAAPDADTDGTEVSDINYERQAASFAAAADGEIANDAEITFPAVDDTTGPIVGWALCTAATAGAQLFFGALTPVTLTAGGQLVVPVGSLVLSEE